MDSAPKSHFYAVWQLKGYRLIGTTESLSSAQELQTKHPKSNLSEVPYSDWAKLAANSERYLKTCRVRVSGTSVDINDFDTWLWQDLAERERLVGYMRTVAEAEPDALDDATELQMLRFNMLFCAERLEAGVR